MKTVAIIQARMASTRLPGKVLADVAGRPMLHFVVTRAQRAKNLDQVVVATSTEASDDLIAEFCATERIAVFRGNESDVLDRYRNAAERFAAGVVVRLTADCPLLDAEVIDKTVDFFRRGDFDYASNTIEPTYPDGLDTEVFTRAALETAWRDARLKSEREHVTPYIHKNPEMFRLGIARHTTDLSGARWTVDEPQDLEFVRAVYAHFGRTDFGMMEIIEMLTAQPQLSRINCDLERNAGYLKSLREDELLSKGETN